MDENSSGKLPPLPPSDQKSLEGNQYDFYYKYKARDFWKDAKLVREEPKDFQKCEHHFVPTADGAICQACHFGLVGFFEISNGKLVANGKTIEI